MSADVGGVLFPAHTAPSEKARCHLLQRFPPQSEASLAKFETNSMFLALKKVAEIMCLKDPQYKPCSVKNKLNPFTALQFSGVKKIIGGVNNSYTSGAGDLFSSCFELPSPLFNDAYSLKDVLKESISRSSSVTTKPSSLPGTPAASKKVSNINVEKTPIQYKENNVLTNADETNETVNAEDDINLQKNGTLKKVNSLYSHPLFKMWKESIEPKSNNHSQDDICESELLMNVNSQSDNKQNLTRRGSTESGFFSCFYDDLCLPQKHCICCCDAIIDSDKTKTDIEIDGCYLSDPKLSSQLCSYCNFHVSSTTTDVTSISSPLEDFNRRTQLDSQCIDIGLLNRLSLDSEINNLMQQRSVLANQLLYCNKRSSSIYTDSSEDISSLAGSDSLLCDERMNYSGFNGRSRSAQISKIVEYFERKGANFRHTSMDSSKFRVPSDDVYNANSINPSQHISKKDLEKRFGFDCNKKAEYDEFCLGLESSTSNPGSSQQRLVICKGAVKSKLSLFDKRL